MKRGKSNESKTAQAERLFGQDRIRSLRCRRVGGPRQHLALPLSCSQVRRRHLPAHLHHPRLHLRLHHDRSRDGTGPDDQEKPGGCVRLLRQKGRAFLRRLDQRHHPHPHRPLLLGHRRLGHPVSGRLHRRPRQRAGSGRLFLRLHFQRPVGGDLLRHLYRLHPLYHLCRRAQRRGAGVQGDDAHPRGALRHHRRLLRHPPGRAGGCEILPRAQHRQLLVDDCRDRNGADVLLPLHRYGHPRHLRLLYEEGRLHRGVHRKRGDL